MDLELVVLKPENFDKILLGSDWTHAQLELELLKSYAEDTIIYIGVSRETSTSRSNPGAERGR